MARLIINSGGRSVGNGRGRQAGGCAAAREEAAGGTVPGAGTGAARSANKKPVLTPENRAEVLPRFFGLSRREAEAVAASLRPAEVVPTREVITAVRPAAPALRGPRLASRPRTAPTGIVRDRSRFTWLN